MIFENKTDFKANQKPVSADDDPSYTCQSNQTKK